MTTIIPGVPQRVLLLDKTRSRWLIATVGLETDIRPAMLDGAGRYHDWPGVAVWTQAQVGNRVSLDPLHDSLAWLICEVRP